ncbi:MAG: alpha/beta hydrolase [Promethearchaeota archaeon]
MKKYLNVKNITLISLCFHVISIALGLIYAISTRYNISWDIGGFAYIFLLFYNFFYFYYISHNLNKKNRSAKIINALLYLYLLIQSVSMPMMMFGNFFLSSSYSTTFSDAYQLYFLIYGGFFGSLTYGLLLNAYIFKQIEVNELWDFSPKTYHKTLRRKIIDVIVLCIVLGFGFYLASIVLFGYRAFLGMVIPELALGFSFMFFAATAIVFKDVGQKNRKIYHVFTLITLIISVILFMPYALTPVAIRDAEKNFSEAFGEDWRNKIPTDVENKYFLKTQFSTLQYFLGVKSNNYIVEKDVLYFDGSKSPYEVDENITLYFDVYYPKEYSEDLPGQGSVLIRIHGGSWRSYDKGLSNMMQMNKYFASQGYIVFDIQYGLHRPNRQGDIFTPVNVLGNFNIDDMIRHIGEFTKYLAAHADQYNANLNSVFISGGSAGGHLACATALAIDSGRYRYLFSPKIKVKGIIPFYPGNVLPYEWGTPELVRPELMITAESPPSLVFQGYQDALVHWTVSQRWKDTYTAAGNQECAIIYFPLCGHANDLYFNSHFNLVFVYYMERFMYIYH